MEANNYNRTIALAALFLCTEGVRQIASSGKTDSDLFECCIQSILHDKDVNSIEEIYGGIANLQLGFRILMNQLGGASLDTNGKMKNLEDTRYAVSLLGLERQLSRQPEMYKKVIEGIGETQQQLELFEPLHTNIIARLADIYTKNISKLGNRIMVKGDQAYLGNPENAARIRALLLAGIRAALLWRQAGGGRWKLIFGRSALIKEAEQQLKRIRNQYG